jgi:HD-GYP domain-containing protein (c-di-GMP phosphodiesterase class II)
MADGLVSRGHSGDPQLEKIAAFIMRLVEGRFPDLGAHHQRLRVIAVSFGRHLGLASGEVKILSVGAHIHDIGKLSISEHILNKPARLTATELLLVRQHPEIGVQLLKPLGLDERISEIVYCHHENFDGSGYPQGLAGEAIPLLARMVRILDSFDALTTDRPYHKGVANGEALRALQEDAHCYDPALLGYFIEMISNDRDSRF